MAGRREEDSDDETFVKVGSAFELLETPEDVQRAKERKEKEQYVTDSQGRRRFHGAFTGGFSAGYFNTVGSKEGWVPSSFVSSRGQKAEYNQQRPEDYMDEEDLGVHGIAPREVAARDEFVQNSGTKRPHTMPSHSDVIPGEPPLQDLIVPSRSTVGAQLLKAMGWREGEGVGPKVMKYPPRSQGADSTDDSAYPQRAEGFLFAPRDTTPWQFEGKDDRHGIGYSGMEEQTVLKAQTATGSLYGMSGEAFGIGALEEEDEEDEVYGVESLAAYDVALAREGDISMERKYGWTGGSETDSWSLEAFVKASRPLPRPKCYAPPSVPRDFVPVHKFIAQREKPSTADAGKEIHQKPLSSTQRSQIIADTSGSVFSLLGAEGRERLKKATDLAKQLALQPPSGGSLPPLPPVGSERSHQPASDREQPKFSVDRLKPFAHDPSKQARYEAHVAGETSTSGAGSDAMTEWERQKEREQFSRMARVHQPLSTSLESRFTRSQGEGGEVEKEPEVPESDAVQAAKANMFGILTREVQDWQPHRLLCRRFNVPDPYPQSGLVSVGAGVERTRPREQRSLHFQQAETMAAEPCPVEQSQPERPRTEAGHTGEAAVAHGPSEHSAGVQTGADEKEQHLEEEEEETEEEPPRPPIDLFKAIFAESSSESEVSDMEEETEQPSTYSQTLNTQQANLNTRPSNVTSITPSAQTLANEPRKWKDLSLLTAPHSDGRIAGLDPREPPKTGPNGLSSEHPRRPDGRSTHLSADGTQSSVGQERAQPSADQGDELTSLQAARVRGTYGPTLPPQDAGSIKSEAPSITVELSELKVQSSHKKHTKHKHKHHKETRRHEGHRHRKAKREHHKSSHKHSDS